MVLTSSPCGSAGSAQPERAGEGPGQRLEGRHPNVLRAVSPHFKKFWEEVDGLVISEHFTPVLRLSQKKKKLGCVNAAREYRGKEVAGAC